MSKISLQERFEILTGLSSFMKQGKNTYEKSIHSYYLGNTRYYYAAFYGNWWLRFHKVNEPWMSKPATIEEILDDPFVDLDTKELIIFHLDELKRL